jgi:hypothetical protein
MYVINCIINALYNYYIIFIIKASSNNTGRKTILSNWWLLLLFVWQEDCKTFCLKSRTGRSSHRQPGATMTDIQSILHTAPDLCKYVSLAVLFGRHGNSYTVSTQSGICIYTISILHSIDTLFGQKKYFVWTAVTAACEGSLSVCHRFTSTGLVWQECWLDDPGSEVQFWQF